MSSGITTAIYSLILAVGSAVLGALISDALKGGLRHYGQRRLLGIGTHDDVLFVYATRGAREAGKVMPPITTEDALAITNVLSALLAIRWRGKAKFVDPDNLTVDDRDTHHLVCICSSLSNSFTRQVIERAREVHPQGVHYFQEPTPGRHATISDGDVHIESDAWGLIEEADRQRVGMIMDRIKDAAIIAKFANPWNDHKKAFVVAGLRGIGTWGAAEFLKKHWRLLYDAKGGRKGKRKDGFFSAAVRITYQQLDIREFELIHLHDLT